MPPTGYPQQAPAAPGATHGGSHGWPTGQLVAPVTPPAPRAPQLPNDPAIVAFSQAPMAAPGARKVAPPVMSEESSDESEIDENPYTAEHVQKSEERKKKKKGPASKHQNAASTPQHHHGHHHHSHQNGSLTPRSNRREQDIRWASEDVKGIKDVEFDFAANLSLFDKQTVFDEIRQQDKTDPNARLVAHNQQNRPVGLPGKVPNNEMITQQSDSNWNFGASDDSSASIATTTTTATNPLLAPAVTPAAAAAATAPSRVPANLRTLRKGSEQLGRAGAQYKFVARNTNTECPCASPVQVAELERLVAESFGISESVLSENAARGVAELALKALGGTARFQSKNRNSRPCVVALIGDHRAGCRALGALRHLSNRLVTTIAVVPSKDVSHSSALTAQLRAFEASGGKVVARLDKLRAVLSTLDSPVELIVDGLQGYQTFEDLWEEDALATAIALVEWANALPCDSISLDIPAGLDASTGLPCSQQIFLRAKWVLSCGFPLTGTLNAHLAEVIPPAEWTHYLIDVGIPRAALDVGSMKRFQTVWFGANWYIELSLTTS